MPAGLMQAGPLADAAPAHVLITTDAVGGVWSYSLALAAGLSAAGRTCTLAVLGPAPDGHQQEAVAAIPGCMLVHTGLELDWTVDSAAALTRIAQNLAELADETRASTAHLHAPCIAAADWPVPVVVTAHSCMATWWDAVRGGARPAGFTHHAEATRKGLDRADCVVAPSEAFAADLRRVYAISRPIEVIRNGLPATNALPQSRQGYILVAGRLWDEGKNMTVLDAAAALLDVPVQAAGPLHGADGASFAPSHLIPLGTLPASRLHAAMAGAALFAAPSLYEPFGLCVLEAAQTGAPLVLADIPTFRELWDGAACFVDPRDPVAWARCMAALMADPDARAALGEAARTRAQSYTLAAMVDATAALHARAAAGARRAA